MYLKYQLPSDPTVYVDLLDDEDVQLMFDEVSHSCLNVVLHYRTSFAAVLFRSSASMHRAHLHVECMR